MNLKTISELYRSDLMLINKSDFHLVYLSFEYNTLTSI